MVIPDTFGRRGVRSIASYNFRDIAEGTGYVNFYLTYSQSGASLLPQLIQNVAIESAKVGFDVETTDIDFDLNPFNLPKTILGNIYVAFHTVNSGDSVITITATKVSDTETDIGSTTLNAGNGTDATMGKIVAGSRVHFKKGDILRISFKANNSNGLIGSDPTGGTSVNFTVAGDSKTTVAIPFDLDL